MKNKYLGDGLKKVTALNNLQSEFPDKDIVLVEKGKAYTPPPKPPKQNTAFPQHLLNMPGLMGDIYKWIMQTSYMPQPILALANTLAFFGALTGRKVATPSNLRTNFYVLGVSESGSGKDHSRKCIKHICKAASAQFLLGGEDFSSDSAILNAVSKNPSTLFQCDEIGHMLDVTINKSSPAYLRGIPPLLTKLFSSASTMYLGREYADPKRERTDIDQPNVCIYGTTVPSRLYEAMGPSEFRDGFMGRQLVFVSETPDPTANEDAIMGEVPRNITCMVKQWVDRRNESVGDIGSYLENVPETIQIDEDAKFLLKEFADECVNEKQWNRDGSGLDSMWARGAEHSKKAALAYACSASFTQPIIDARAASWGIDIAKYCITNICDIAKDHISDTAFGKDELKVYRVIKNAGDRGVTKSELCRRTQGMKVKQRNEITDSLILSDMVERVEVETNKPGKNKLVWVAKHV